MTVLEFPATKRSAEEKESQPCSRNYKVYWKSKFDEVGWFTTVTKDNNTILYKENGAECGSYNHGIIPGENELDNFLRRHTAADPAAVYASARELGAKGGLGEIDLVMDHESAAALEKEYSGTIKLKRMQ